MDVAKINFDDPTKIDNLLNCDMPTYGQHIFYFYKRDKDWFMRYEGYPIVKASVGADLYMGLNTEYIIKILPSSGGEKEINGDNITSFYIGMIKK